MADSNVAITAGLGTAIDTRTETTNNNHRQVVCLGDPASNAGVAPVDPTSGLTVNAVPSTTGGCSTYHAVAGASTNTANVKASAGQVYGVVVFNNAAYPVYVKLHNTAGTPTAGAGVVRTIGVQAGATVSASFPRGLAFGTGIGISIVKDIADAGTTVLVASDCVVDLEYK